MAQVTLKRPANSRAATVSVPGVTEPYVVRENGTVEVHEDHAQHLRGAGFLWPHEVEEDALVIKSDAPAAPAADDKAGDADSNKEPEDGFSKLNLADLQKWLADNGATPEQVAAVKSKKDGRAAARAIVASKAKEADPLS